MRQLFTLILLTFSVNGIAQDSIVSLDVLSAPQSPAANLMGFTESEILKPESPTDVMTNIKSASNGLTMIPNSLALDLRLKNLFKSTENNSYSDYIRIAKSNGKADVWNNVQQTAIVSLGYQNFLGLNDTIRTGQSFGLGFKVSLFRGSSLNSDFKKYYDSLIVMKQKIGSDGAASQQAWKASEEYKMFKKEIIAAKRANDEEKAKLLQEKADIAAEKFVKRINTENEAEYEKIRKVAEKLEFKTYGFVWDVAAGSILNYPTNEFEYSLVGKAGLWTTFGYEAKNGWSFLGLGRALYTPDFSYTNTAGILDTSNVANYDFGGRILYEYPGKSFSLSAEGIYRGAFGNAYDPMYRFTFNVGYEIRKNMKLTLMLGRNYDGAITREGNVISALQLLMGFGSKKNLSR
ncbi:MAG: hypothetical protein Crog4KO_21340 [Crocinitomicaceae bacterium]